MGVLRVENGDLAGRRVPVAWRYGWMDILSVPEIVGLGCVMIPRYFV